MFGVSVKRVSIGLAALLVITFAVPASASDSATSSFNSNHRVELGIRAGGFASKIAAASSSPINYRGGRTMNNPTVYLIWYGSWSGTPCTDSSTTTPGLVNYML